MSMQTAPDQYMELAGARLRWRLEGSGPAIVLLHGWALDLEYWDPAVELLAPDFTVLRFDRRGFGLSGGLPDSHQDAADLQMLLDAAGIQRAVVVGMSQGARLALRFALLHPGRVRALVLDGAPSTESTEPELPLADYREQLEEKGPAALQAQILRHPLMGLRTANPSARQLLGRIVGRYRGRDLLQPGAQHAPVELAAIAAPTLVIHGESDSAARREAAHRLREVIPGAYLEQLPAGHLTLLDAPAAYAQAVAAFCHGLPP